MSYCFMQWLSIIQSQQSIAVILQAYIREKDSNAKKSSTFSNYIRNVCIEDNETCALGYQLGYLRTWLLG